MSQNIAGNPRLYEAFSTALEDRAKTYQDIISDSSILLKIMKDRGMMKEFSGPTIRQALMYQKSGTYSGKGDFAQLSLESVPVLNDAEWTPKAVYVSIVIGGLQELRNSGSNQIYDLMTTHVEAAEIEMKDGLYRDLHGDGTLYGGNQITGLNAAIPIVNSVGTYGGINRANWPNWRTGSYDINSGIVPGVTQATGSTIKRLFDYVMMQRMRNNKGPDLILASQEHYAAYVESLDQRQIINDTSGTGYSGFKTLKYFGANMAADVALDGGTGTSMPANTSYFIDTKNIMLRYHPDANFSPLFKKNQQPINQDALVNHLRFFGELTIVNPFHFARLYDSNPSA